MTIHAVNDKRLLELEKKERAHDDYLAGLRILKARAAAIDLEVRGLRDPDVTPRENRDAFARGYRQALNDISVAILAASQARGDEQMGSS